MRRLRPGLAAMTTSPALAWLDAQFQETMARYAGDFRHAAGHRKKWHGPEHVRPMIESCP